ncbi:U3 small nucleolar RNA-associated protein 18 homolog [Magnolia sinica]|uniref:U3 small nucleolar RNA-associated protein 18 homolog n=1 Tax=Magnolia sinica TaxID=86752 RepID=UPI0026587B62|nr:U3 small nucleolar RNA-associated protein 18 homolog [Magnolia sinica]XP_058108194.1 U3 small nucleolar RNA-associated protein 18 homolog [Magnolia sinica]XP_058108195.1 U3 small nucleolar RNA-associated protein 18 homolog [Magnolia sinica]XP_058108197.1 U3 small nucleolar RNA-associated protein 18 homolog [Magnolia sinica]XP_058108198.1 U3 small nucleolar RNA-associated protein 18 homolog [Magnolia sinica]XP_058108199.1 U3 small nucleolar RNA-associated protein 18 homolog [Magnolia sinica]
MSLISQNLPSKKRLGKVRREESDGPPLSQRDDESELTDKPDSVISSGKKRRTERDSSLDEKHLEVEQKNEMKRLENFLFGSLYDPVEFGKEVEEEAGKEISTGPALFFTDRSANADVSVFEEDVVLQDGSDGEKPKLERKPAWIDDEEERTKVDIAKVNRLRKLRREEDESSISGTDYVSRLRAQHIKLNPGTEWAQLGPKLGGYRSDDESDDDDGVIDDDDILRTSEDLVVKSRTKLLPGLLEYSRLTDANAEDPSNGPINSVQFHRNAQLLLAAGLDKRLRLFQIDGKRNTKIQSIFLEDCPIRKAAFVPDGSQVIIGGRRKFFYSFDLVKARVDKIGPLTGRDEKSLEVFEVSPDSNTIAFVGNEGYILLVSSKTKELIGTLKMNGTARSLAFADDGRQLLSSGGDGHVYHWDLRTRKCFHKAVDEGCISGSALCTSLDSRLFAAGSSSGIVNIYNREEFLGGKRKPIKTIDNLVTKIDGLKFNHDAQILAITSSMQKNSLKLVHVPSYNVFSNWPSSKHNLQHPRCLDFSPGSGFMAVGNAAGKVFLYKLHHYQHA